jgi:hypothetical protein
MPITAQSGEEGVWPRGVGSGVCHMGYSSQHAAGSRVSSVTLILAESFSRMSWM